MFTTNTGRVRVVRMEGTTHTKIQYETRADDGKIFWVNAPIVDVTPEQFVMPEGPGEDEMPMPQSVGVTINGEHHDMPTGTVLTFDRIAAMVGQGPNPSITAKWDDVSLIVKQGEAIEISEGMKITAMDTGEV